MSFFEYQPFLRNVSYLAFALIYLFGVLGRHVYY